MKGKTMLFVIIQIPGMTLSISSYGIWKKKQLIVFKLKYNTFPVMLTSMVQLKSNGLISRSRKVRLDEKDCVPLIDLLFKHTRPNSVICETKYIKAYRLELLLSCRLIIHKEVEDVRAKFYFTFWTGGCCRCRYNNGRFSVKVDRNR